MALLITPIKIHPRKAPAMLPFPPSKVTPPIIAAVSALVSYPNPAFAVIESILAEKTIAAIEQNIPAKE